MLRVIYLIGSQAVYKMLSVLDFVLEMDVDIADLGYCIAGYALGFASYHLTVVLNPRWQLAWLR